LKRAYFKKELYSSPLIKKQLSLRGNTVSLEKDAQTAVHIADSFAGVALLGSDIEGIAGWYPGLSQEFWMVPNPCS
jgi:hypothetical protein